MKVTGEYMRQILDEMKVVEQQWGSAVTPEEKLYYFSAIFGAINRVMNFECDPVLVFVHQVLQALHHAVVNRLNSPKPPGQEVFLGVPAEMIDAILSALEELRAAFTKYASGENADAETWNVLKRFANIAYAATGNGFYLYLRGKLLL